MVPHSLFQKDGSVQAWAWGMEARPPLPVSFGGSVGVYQAPSLRQEPKLAVLSTFDEMSFLSSGAVGLREGWVRNGVSGRGIVLHEEHEGDVVIWSHPRAGQPGVGSVFLMQRKAAEDVVLSMRLYVFELHKLWTLHED